MAVSSASLLRLLQESQAKVAELESRGPEIVERVVTEVVQVAGLERVITQPPKIKEVIKVVYHDNPEHLETIKALQEKLWQFTSQSDS